MIKKIMALVLSLVLCFSLFACGDNTPPPNPPVKGKPILVFQIDEGVQNKELLGIYEDDLEGLDKAVDNIITACAPLKQKYDVVYHIYAHYQYKAVGYGGDASKAENRLSPVLKHFMAYMTEKGEKVIIEAYSSGVGTHQSGALASLPEVAIRYGDSSKIGGFTMDVDCYEYLADTYGAFYGVRFHELVGSNKLGGNVQPGNNFGTGFKVSETAVEAIIDVMKAKNKTLVWGDHSWDTIYLEATVDMWLDMLTYGAENLGQKMIINYSNNSWDTIKSLEMKPFLRAEDTAGAATGYSVQTWFWQESDTASYAGLLGSTKWYKGAYMDMPPELMAASSLTGFKNGGVLVQYEPTEYFFNALPSHIAGKQDCGGFYEDKPDYSARPTLLRFIDLMMREEGDKTIPPMNSLDYYQSSETKLDNNFEQDPPDKYFQTTLGVIGADNKEGKDNKFYDTYNPAPQTIYEQNDNRYRAKIFEGAKKISRVNLTFGGLDEMLILSGDTPRADFYYYNSTNLGAEGNIFADNANGKVIDFTAANLVREYVNNLDNDPDEIIVARESGNTINFEVYSAADSTVNNVWAFKYALNANSDAILNDYLGKTSVSKESFVALSAYRFRNALHSDKTRSYDSIAALTTSGGKLTGSYKLKNSTKEEGKIVTKTFSADVDGEIVDITSGDLNQDRVDEIILLTKKGGIYSVSALTTDGITFAYDTNYAFDLSGDGYKNLFTQKFGTYYKQSLMLAVEK